MSKNPIIFSALTFNKLRYIYYDSMVNPREALLNLQPIESDVEVVSSEKIRPLGAFSDFVVNELGKHNELIREGQMVPDVLFDKAEALISQVPSPVFEGYLGDDVAGRRDAILDLVWVIRSLDIANQDSPEWKAQRDDSQLFKSAKALSDKEIRHPNLSWSDIALYHPLKDPRTFLPPGEDRDQEVLLYRTQSGIDAVFKKVTEGGYGEVLLESLSEMNDDLDATVKATVYLSQVRRLGQFYKLDPFLGANNEYIGHGTGAFSAWSYTAGYFLAGNEAFRDRALREENQRAFDRDADVYINQMRMGGFGTLRQIVADEDMNPDDKVEAFRLVKAASDKFALFLRAHRGAIKKHAPASFDDEAPAALGISNDVAIHTAIIDMQDGKPVHFFDEKDDQKRPPVS